MARGLKYGCHGVVLAVLLVMAFVPRAGAVVFDPESFILSNGMQVVVIPNHRSPIIVHMVWYKVGAADDPPGKSGIAHFFEHLMFKEMGGFVSRSTRSIPRTYPSRISVYWT